MKSRLVDLVRYLQVPLSARAIAANLGMSKTTVGRYARLLQALGLPPGKDHVGACTGRELAAHFNGAARDSGKTAPDFTRTAQRLEEPGMTLRRLHSEYQELAGEQALGYVQFTRRYAAERKTKGLALRRQHVPGFVAFVDYSGKRPSYVDRATGSRVDVELFVGVLGHSGLTFACCSHTQSVPDWLDAHTKMVAFFGGAPKTVVPDNLKSAVIRAGKDPTVQRHYLEWGKHNGIAVLPARAGQPRDKGQVEKAVLDVQRWVLPELAKRKHFSLEELNDRVQDLMRGFNERPFQKRDGCRRSVFEQHERAALGPLPTTAYAYAKWTGKMTVPADYHVPVHGHYYSVPHTLVGQRVEARVSPEWVELVADGEPVAKHRRHTVRGEHTTAAEHQPEAHRAMGERTPEHVREWARTIGPSMAQVVDAQFARRVPLQGLQAALALRDLEVHWTGEGLEAAAKRAITRRVPNFTGVKRALTELVAGADQEGREAIALRRTARRRAASAAAPPKRTRSRRSQPASTANTRTRRRA